MKLTPPFIITLVYLVMVFVLMLLMGTEIISNRTVTDRLLVTIPVTALAVIGYWFTKNKNGNAPRA